MTVFTRPPWLSYNPLLWEPVVVAQFLCIVQEGELGLCGLVFWAPTYICTSQSLVKFRL